VNRAARRAAIQMMLDQSGLGYLEALKLVKLLNYGKVKTK